ncbi:MAG TPA: Co2+/Mg2+ efflux protein ApaG [Gammaproteobacteria bacterium]|nr:Co2+/Mg2+ efflux protein ApaG [Gammaproteobacteria bacterium]
MKPNLISVDVESRYIESQSQPDMERFVFAYTVTLTNQGNTPARLLSRHWIITDANDQVREVKDIGVVGKNPRITPGDTFSYSSHAILETPHGILQGSYDMLSDDGETFVATIPKFNVTAPDFLH